jgi:tetratricopeptide (TPR) repeat protein
MWVLLAAGSASAQFHHDEVRLYSKGPVRGHIDSASKSEVTISVPAVGRNPPTTETIEVNDIMSVTFDEPGPMRDARNAAEKGDFEKAIALLNKAVVAQSPELVQEELEYLKAYYLAQRAIHSAGKDRGAPSAATLDLAKSAYQGLSEFTSKHPDSLHYYDCKVAIGDLLVATKNYDKAMSFYQALTEASWPEYKARADLLRGRALQQEGKFADALTAYQAVASANLSSELGKLEMAEAGIASAYCLAGAGRAEEGVKSVKAIIAGCSDDKFSDIPRLAQAYNALGNCYRALKNNQQALWAYLHVTVEYKKATEAQPEALANLAIIWKEMGKGDRANEARDELKARYPNSRWNQR